jgi:exodeoxyribonuclease VII large subunit
MNEAPTHIFSIAELNQTARLLLESEIGETWVMGEISNLSRPASGHLYFTLKDKSAQVRCALFRFSRRNVHCAIEDGMQVLVHAKVSLYEGRGDYQLIVSQLEPAGDGALQLAFEKLKKTLAEAGLFDEKHKKSLPQHPTCIGVITSSSGAALQDILHVLRRRSPLTPIIIYPTMVQGDTAKQAIVQAIEIANQRNECDVLILARGGGSLEDLWPFNEKTVAHAIFNSQLPIISGVGHEVDFTIADFVADQRAPTPSAAAELASFDQTTLLAQYQQLQQRLNYGLKQLLATQQQRLHHLTQRLRHPKERLQMQAQQLDHLEQRLQIATLQHLKQTQQQCDQLQQRLPNPLIKITTLKQILLPLQDKLTLLMQQLQYQKTQKLQNIQQRLNALSPLSTLERGYTLTKDQHGKTISTSKILKTNDKLTLVFCDGEKQCQVL